MFNEEDKKEKTAYPERSESVCQETIEPYGKDFAC
jgi:hypothetical protein